MKKILNILILMNLIILTACNKKVEPHNKDYNGLYNALTYNYKKNLITIKKQISKKRMDYNNNFKEYDKLNSTLNNKKDKVIHYQKDIKNLKHLLKKISTNLKDMDTQRETKPLLQKIDTQIIKMQNKIILKSSSFNIN